MQGKRDHLGAAFERDGLEPALKLPARLPVHPQLHRKWSNRFTGPLSLLQSFLELRAIGEDMIQAMQRKVLDSSGAELKGPAE